MRKNIVGTYQLLWRIQRNILLLIVICLAFAAYHLQTKTHHEQSVVVESILNAVALWIEIGKTTEDNQVKASDAAKKLLSPLAMHEKLPELYKQEIEPEFNKLTQILKNSQLWFSEAPLFGRSQNCTVLLFPEEDVNGYQKFLEADAVMRFYPELFCTALNNSLLPVAVVIKFQKNDTPEVGFIFPWNVGKLIADYFSPSILRDCERYRWCFENISLFPEDSVFFNPFSGVILKMDQPIKQKLAYIPINFMASVLGRLVRSEEKVIIDGANHEQLLQYLRNFYETYNEKNRLERKATLEYGGLMIHERYAPLAALAITLYLIAIIYMDVSKLDHSRKVTSNYLPNIFLESSGLIGFCVKIVLLLAPLCVSLLVVSNCFDYYRWNIGFFNIPIFYVNPMEWEFKFGEQELNHFNSLVISPVRGLEYDLAYFYTLVGGLLLWGSAAVLTYRLGRYVSRNSKSGLFCFKKQSVSSRSEG